MATFTLLSPLPSIVSMPSSSVKTSALRANAIRASSGATEPSSYPILQNENEHGSPRRQFLKAIALQTLPLLFLNNSPLPSLAREVEVGSYLPPSPSDPSFVLFKASSKDTPALRAGTFYSFLSTTFGIK